MFFEDPFKAPPFIPDIVIPIDEVIDTKFQMYNCHVSQIYEWLPYTHGEIDKVPADEKERLEWYRGPRIPRDRALSVQELEQFRTKNHSEFREAMPASKYRDLLVKRYGEAGKNMLFAEAFMLSEYGKKLDDDNVDELFPF